MQPLSGFSQCHLLSNNLFGSCDTKMPSATTISLSLKISHHDSLRIAAVTLIALLCLLYLCVDIVQLCDQQTLPGKLENVQAKNCNLGTI